MKRFVFALFLLLAVIGFNTYCLCAVKSAKNEVIMRLDELSKVLYSEGTTEKTSEKADEFIEFWKTKQDSLSRIIRHDLLDKITSSSSAFKELSVFGESGELSAEIARCRAAIEEIWDSERPLLRNIF